MREVLAGSPRRASRVYAGRRGDEEGDPRVPHLPPRADHARAGRAADLRRPPRSRAAPRGGRRPRRRERPVLHAPGARRHERRLRERARGARPGAAARRRRARPPLRPRPRRPADRARARAGARPSQRVRPEVQWTLDAITGAAAFVGNDRLDILAANQLGRALFSELYAAPARPANHARFVFLDPRAEAFYPDWDRAARDTVAILRSAAGRDPHDRDLSDLVGELATQSEAFRTHWAAHNVRFHATAVKHFHHPVVGELSLSFNRLDARRRPRADALHLHRRARLALRGGAQAARELGGHGRRQ